MRTPRTAGSGRPGVLWAVCCVPRRHHFARVRSSTVHSCRHRLTTRVALFLLPVGLSCPFGNPSHSFLFIFTSIPLPFSIRHHGLHSVFSYGRRGQGPCVSTPVTNQPTSALTHLLLLLGNDEIENQLKRDRIMAKNEIKMLLLGAGESGKVCCPSI